MEHLRKLTIQQLTLAAAGALLFGGTALSRGHALGWLGLTLALGAAAAAIWKSRTES